VRKRQPARGGALGAPSKRVAFVSTALPRLAPNEDVLHLSLRQTAKEMSEVMGVKAVLGGCAAMIVLAACASSAPPRIDPVPEGPQGNACVPDTACDCGKGVLGKTKCGEHETSCECPTCAPITTATLAPWTACGGEPFGRWRLDGLDLSASKLTITGVGRLPLGQCDAELPLDPAQPADIRLELASGGSARSVSFAQANVVVPLSCVQSLTGDSATCATLQGTTPCTMDECHRCYCGLELKLGETGAGSWSRDGSTLKVGAIGTAEYCVQGDTMTLRRPDNVVITMKRTFVMGRPQACAERDAASCSAGNGCSLGQCMGGETCAKASSESACATYQGCTWDRKVCIGEADKACSLADYDRTPGCHFTSAKPHCVGQATRCTARSYAECTASPGCTNRVTCAGGPIDCSLYDYKGAAACVTVPGCTYGDDFKCRGTGKCEQYDIGVCEQRSECHLQGCEGQATACEAIAEDACELAPGCHLEVARP
jgi:hypothetical protein